jgi:5-methylcytosine-specific restriction endonuclease McrA
MKKTLLLNSNYEFLSFISERKLIKLILKEKVEILSNWNEKIIWSNGFILKPSVVKLKYYIRFNQHLASFSRRALLNRDNNTCQYCNTVLILSEITVDHIIPKSQNGATSFSNCVVCCKSCNSKKANKTPEQAKMVLIRKPTHPKFSNKFNYDIKDWHEDWDSYLAI